MTEDELAAIEARTIAATPGPWRWAEREFNARKKKKGNDWWALLLVGPRKASAPKPPRDDEYDYPRIFDLNWWSLKGKTWISSGPLDADRDFIAASRTDIPALVAEVRRLRALVGDRDVGEWCEHGRRPGYGCCDAQGRAL